MGVSKRSARIVMAERRSARQSKVKAIIDSKKKVVAKARLSAAPVSAPAPRRAAAVSRALKQLAGARMVDVYSNCSGLRHRCLRCSGSPDLRRLAGSPSPPSSDVSSPPPPPNPTRAILALHGLVAVRAAVLRPGRTFSGGRSSNLEAQLVQITGQVVLPGCEHCQKGAGLWTLCVQNPRFLGKSCGNCHYSSEGARCSLRRVAGPPPAAAAAAIAAAAAASPSSASAGRSRRRNDSAEVAPLAKRLRSVRRPAAAAAPPARRRRTPSQRARRFAELYRELAALHEEEAEVLEDKEEEDIWAVPESPRAGSLELNWSAVTTFGLTL
ncbi:hypothetical protein BKA65DRAFT_583794 [Rhexocercosporidium sp. MPI-PUGE-AT-0058]|nr:hypothetical protein BKA65DRAFT_583794 [Rhexocercosporidium sp. MPI-PUGE-AT-0058]